MERARILTQIFGGTLDFCALRTTHVNQGIELGFDVKTAQTLARHENPHLTMNTYGRANAERLRATVEVLGEAINAAESKNSRKVVERGVLPLAVGAEVARNSVKVKEMRDFKNGEGDGARTRNLQRDKLAL